MVGNAILFQIKNRSSTMPYDADDDDETQPPPCSLVPETEFDLIEEMLRRRDGGLGDTDVVPESAAEPPEPAQMTQEECGQLDESLPDSQLELVQRMLQRRMAESHTQSQQGDASAMQESLMGTMSQPNDDLDLVLRERQRRLMEQEPTEAPPSSIDASMSAPSVEETLPDEFEQQLIRGLQQRRQQQQAAEEEEGRDLGDDADGFDDDLDADLDDYLAGQQQNQQLPDDIFHDDEDMQDAAAGRAKAVVKAAPVAKRPAADEAAPAAAADAKRP